MGGAISAGRDNNDLVEKLVRARYLRSSHVHRVFRAVDRGDYFVPVEKKRAYDDLAWKYGLLHLSSPCIYCDVMEGLRLKPGLSFLNLGSGTGYLSTMAGLILGTGGVNHGIEVHSEVVQYAYERLNDFILNSPAVDEFDFCEPKFIVGNCLSVSPPEQQYDRVYCGAACPEEYENYMKNLIKVGGILVMPLQDNLLWIRRISLNQWVTKKLHCVSFSTLVAPNVNQNQPVAIPDITPSTLQVMCRARIRSVLRDVIAYEEPILLESLMKSEVAKPKKKHSFNHVKTFCLSVDEEDSDSDFNRLHNLDSESGSREMNALLRLVLSMGNRARDFQDFQEVISEDDTNDSSSSDQDSSMSESDSSQSSQTNNGNEGETPNRQNRSTVTRSSSVPDLVYPDGSIAEDVPPSSSKLSDNSMDTPQSTNPTTRNSSDNSESKRNKSDSGIVDDIVPTPIAEYCSSSSNKSVSDQMDTNSSDDNSVDEARHTDSEDASDPIEETWRQRKRHLTEEYNDSISERGDSSDSDSEERVVTQSKMKRKSPLPPHPYNTNRKTLSNLVQQKIQLLPLPRSLKLFVNMNRDFPM